MSRHGYTDDGDNWATIMWRGRLASATRGKRGQRLLRDLLAALDAMPIKELAGHSLATPDGQVCALGCVARARGIDLPVIDPDDSSEEDTEWIAEKLGVSDCLAKEIAYMNDDWGGATDAQRWTRMRAWVASQIKDAKP